MAAILDSPVACFEEAYWKDRLAFDRAAITPEAYWTRLANALSWRLTDDVLRRLAEIDNASWSRPNLVMARWASALRAAVPAV